MSLDWARCAITAPASDVVPDFGSLSKCVGVRRMLVLETVPQIEMIVVELRFSHVKTISNQLVVRRKWHARHIYV